MRFSQAAAEAILKVLEHLNKTNKTLEGDLERFAVNLLYWEFLRQISMQRNRDEVNIHLGSSDFWSEVGLREVTNRYYNMVQSDPEERDMVRAAVIRCSEK
jgi:hypothetical protein